MKIALVTDSFIPGVGGTEKAVLGLADALSEQGQDVIVCCPKLGKYDDSAFNFPVLRTKSIKVSSNDACALPDLSPKFKKQFNAFAPDIIHCQSISPMATYALKYAEKKHVPVITTVHTKFKLAWERSIKSKAIVNALVRDLCKKLHKSNKVFTVSKDMIAELNSYGYDGNITVIRNGSMLEKIDDLDKITKLASEKYHLQNEKNILLFVGHIVKFKNLQFALDALKLVKEQNQDFKLLLVGHGLDDAYFKKYAYEIGLSDNVIFTGQITDKALLSSLYGVSELFIFPSIFDNDPLTVVEAATHKTPAITIKDTGSSERIQDGVSGFIVENDVRKFADKITYLLNNKQLLKQAGENASNTIPKEWKQTAKEYIYEYENILKEYTKGRKLQ